MSVLNKFEFSTKRAFKQLGKYIVQDYQFNRGEKPKPIYPNDIPLPGTSWNSNVTNSSNQNSGNSNSANTDLKAAEEFYQRGRALSKECQYQNAVAEFTKAIKLDPRNGDYYLYRAYSAYVYIDKTKAEADMKTAQELWKSESKPPADARVSEQLAYDVKVKDRASALDQFNNILRILRTKNQNALGPECKQANNNSTNTNQTFGGSNQMSAAEKAEKIESLDTLYTKSMSKKDYSQALYYVTKIVKLDPQNSNFYSRRGMLYGFLDKYLEAIGEYTKSIELEPNGVNTYLKYTSRGEMYAKLGQYQKAIDDFTKSIEFKSSEPEPFVYRAESYCKLGKIILARQDENSALAKDWQKIRNPCTAEVKQNSVNSNQNSKIDQPNLTSSKQTVQTASQNPPPEKPVSQENFLAAKKWATLGSYQSNQGKHPEAINSYTKAIELRPYSSYYHNRGLAYGAIEEYKKAIADFSKSVETDLTPYDGYYNRGRMFRKVGDNQQSIKDFSKVMELNPGYYFAVRDRAEVYCLLGQTDLAKADEKKVVQLGGKVTNPCSVTTDQNAEGSKQKSNIVSDVGNLGFPKLPSGTFSTKGTNSQAENPSLNEKSKMEPIPSKIDEFGPLSDGAVKGRLDVFMIQLQDDSTHLGYIINYGPAAQVAAMEKVIRDHFAARNFPPDRLVFVNGGVEKIIRTRLWKVPPGADASFID